MCLCLWVDWLPFVLVFSFMDEASFVVVLFFNPKKLSFLVRLIP
uniref:Uncharacterized protein n=1 Tax=Arundo donax TaxID=35708 RepID=A0A0A8ZVA4_ARUDO